MQVSHEAIYQYIYVLPRGELKQLLIKGLSQERKHRRPQKRGDATETRGKIANMLSIEERPAEVAECLPEDALREDFDLLMCYDCALLRKK